MAIFGFIS